MPALPIIAGNFKKYARNSFSPETADTDRVVVVLSICYVLRT